MKNINFLSRISIFSILMVTSFNSTAELLDRIVAVVEDGIILDRELTIETHNIVKKLQANKVRIPPAFILRKQVLERMVVDKLQHQLAERSGIRVSDEMLRNSVADIARRNNLTVEQFRAELEGQGLSFQGFQENIRNEIIVNQLRAREVGSRIKVTDREVNHYLETQGDVSKEEVQYHLGHILISVPEAASASVIKQAKEKAKNIINDLSAGADFKQTAVAVSEGGNALTGGDLGWRSWDKFQLFLLILLLK